MLTSCAGVHVHAQQLVLVDDARGVGLVISTRAEADRTACELAGPTILLVVVLLDAVANHDGDVLLVALLHIAVCVKHNAHAGKLSGM